MGTTTHDSLEIKIALIKAGDRGHAKNSTVDIAWLKEKLFKPVKDKKYTLEQYLDLHPDNQNALKDVGSFVGGPFKDGLRRGGSLKYRSILTLDVDSATPKQIEMLRDGSSKLCKYEFFGSTTRKHTKKKPRYRLVIPLKRKVTVEEYPALARIVASKVFENVESSMDAIDDVSFRAPQIMYFPSVCKDAAFETIENEGKLLNPDKILEKFNASGRDWQNWLDLPYSEKHGQRRPNIGQKAEIPTEKEGLIGAFCRAYDVESAMETFIPGRYIPSDAPSNKPRYTFAHGSGTNGVVVEDDGLFIYSHHSTDPCSEQLVNAWDMVRLHLFGDDDIGMPQDTPPGKLPSFQAMVDLVRDDPKVREELTDEDWAPRELNFRNLDEEDVEDEEPSKKISKKKKRHQREEEDSEDDEPEEDRKAAPKGKKSDLWKDNEPDLTLLEDSTVEAPEWPGYLFGEAWEKEIKLRADNAGAPEDFVGLSLLGTTASLIGNAFVASAKEGWHEPSIFWGMAVGKPSSNKTPGLKAFTKEIAKIERSRWPAYKEHEQNYQQELTKALAAKAAWEKMVKKAEDGEEIPDMPSSAEPPDAPVEPRLLLYDTTLEAACKFLYDRPRGGGIFRDEMSGLLENLSRYSGGTDRPAYLEMYNGGSYTIDRVKLAGKSMRIRHFGASLWGGIQPAKLMRHLAGEDDGLVARLPCFYPRFQPKEMREGKRESGWVLDALTRIADLPMEIDEYDDPCPRVLPFEKKAKRRMWDWANSRADEENFEANDMLLGSFGKANGLVVRLAMIFEFLWWSIDWDNDDPPQRIHDDAVEAAILFRDTYIKPMQERTFGISESDNRMRGLLRYLVKHKPKTIDQRMIYRARVLGQNIKSAEVGMALLEAEQLGWISPPRKSDSTTKSKRLFDVHPKIRAISL